jgi:L-threonylcarbamoyladenylate synthase
VAGPSQAELLAAVAALQRGELVCFPTETYYGLAVDARSQEAVARLIAAKGRREDAPIATIAADVGSARTLWADPVPAPAIELAAAHWPGPLTLVCPAAPGVPAPLVGPDGVGVRVSSHPWAAALAAAFGGPITATSANLTGSAPTRRAAEASAQLGASVAHYLDGGETPGGRPSTIAAIRPDGSLHIIRQGPVRL